MSCALLVVPSAAHAQGLLVRGVVVDENSGAPIATVAVQLADGSRRLLTVLTNTEGRFQFAAPALSQYTPRALLMPPLTTMGQPMAPPCTVIVLWSRRSR